MNKNSFVISINVNDVSKIAHDFTVEDILLDSDSINDIAYIQITFE